MPAGPARFIRDSYMAERTATGRCLDVELFGRRHPALEGVWELLHYQPGVAYRVGSTETWIGSIGREQRTGRIFASVDERFWLDEGFERLPVD
jgi:hypothetical protein